MRFATRLGEIDVLSASRIFLCLASLLPFGVEAHHSIVVHYDPTNVRAITGTLESVQWTNPHSKWAFSVRNDRGVVETWRAEGDAINTLVRNGLTRERFEIGSEITIIGPVARSGRNEMIAAQVVIAGVEYGIFPALADELEEELPELSERTLTSAAGYEISYSAAPDLFRVWTPVDFPATGIRPQQLALTDAARATLATYDPADDDLAAKCVPAGMPSMLDQPYPIEFIDQGDRIIMRIEEWNGRRTIHMTDSDPAEGIGTIYGHSRGRWEGKTLVIETTGIDYPYYNDAGVPLTRNAVVTERYSISPDGRRMEWAATTVDPTVFSGSATIAGWTVWAPAIEIRTFECVLE
jgi:hypothetical protein